MSFHIDTQTKRDLAILPETRNDPSIFSYFDSTTTHGGKATLLEIFNNPSDSREIIDKRMNAIKFLIDEKITFEFDYLELDFIEHYISHGAPILRNNAIDSFVDWMHDKIRPTNEYYIISRGIDYLRVHLSKLNEIASIIRRNDLPEYLQQFILDLELVNAKAEFDGMSRLGKNGLFFFKRSINRYDYLIRKREKECIKNILNQTYLLDALMSVARTATEKGLSFATYTDASSMRVKIKNIFHPHVKDPILNDIRIGENTNLCFLTGPNMAGKSTFLKSVGVCVYLAHLGFPIPASDMETSLFGGMFTSINLSDNINKGYSHYYTEVKRVKDAVVLIKEKKRIFVIFDELFKGTNVKDAFDATRMITSAFAKIKRSVFFISTHIVEVGEELTDEQGILFKYLDSGLQGDDPVYNYKLRDGISTERLGLFIIKKEGIMKIIDEILDSSETE